MPAFVIQRHEKQDEPIHWDLMLEQGEGLKTFRLDQPPERLTTEPGTAIPICDHDRRFLTYEGSVNQGLGRVTLVDSGEYETIGQTARRWMISLRGRILRGRFTIEESEDKTWVFRKEDTQSDGVV